MAKTVIALYDSTTHAQMAVQELHENGFLGQDISLAATDTSGTTTTREGMTDTGEAVATGAIGGAGVGAALGGVAGLLVGLGALTIPGVGPIIAAGPLAAALAGAGVGAVAGGLVGGLVGLGVPEEEANYYAEGVRRGGTLVTVRTTDEQADLAANVLNRHNPVNIKQRATDWRTEGWSRFDPDAGPYYAGDTGAYGTTGERTYAGTGMSDLDREQARYGETYRTERDLTGGMSGREYDRDFDLYESDFRRHYDTNYGTSGRHFDAYQPAYMYGYTLRRSQTDCNGDCRWEDVEMTARRDWEREHPGNAWEEFKDAIREGWNSLVHDR